MNSIFKPVVGVVNMVIRSQ